MEVFTGNTADPATVAAQVTKLKERFGISAHRLGGRSRHADLGAHRAGAQAAGDGLGELAARAADRAAGGRARAVPARSLFDERNLLELTSEHFPGERLVVCRNPVLADERARKRAELLTATEADWPRSPQATQRKRRPLRGRAGHRAARGARDRALTTWPSTSSSTITEDVLQLAAQPRAAIDAEAALDGLYVIRTSLPTLSNSMPGRRSPPTRAWRRWSGRFAR